MKKVTGLITMFLMCLFGSSCRYLQEPNYKISYRYLGDEEIDVSAESEKYHNFGCGSLAYGGTRHMGVNFYPPKEVYLSWEILTGSRKGQIIKKTIELRENIPSVFSIYNYDTIYFNIDDKDNVILTFELCDEEANWPEYTSEGKKLPKNWWGK